MNHISALSSISFHRPGALWLAASLIFILSGCDGQNVSPGPTQETPAPARQASAPAATPQPGPRAPADDACAPLRQLAAMDSRQPVPLQPMMAWHQKQNMMEHLVAIEQITGALANQDWEGVAAAAALIESSPQMQQMCQHMGAGADGFTELALDFHRRADAIAPAAKAQDTAAVLRATSNTLQACTSCHATYRQDVVDPATWQARTGSSHDPAMMHGAH